MRYIVFDIETTNTTFNGDPVSLDLGVVAIYDSEKDLYKSFIEEELPELWPVIERADMLVGFNSNHFDIPILNKYYPGDLTRIKSLDLLEEVRKSLGRRIKLEKIAQGTLGEGKSADGLQAVRWWKEGKVDQVRKYCIKDVEVTKKIYEYALKHGEVKYKEGNNALSIKLDTNEWDKKEDSSMTHTMPF